MIYAKIYYEDGTIEEIEVKERPRNLKREGKRPIRIHVYDDGSFPPRGNIELDYMSEWVYKGLRMAVKPNILNSFLIDESTMEGLKGHHSSQMTREEAYNLAKMA